MRGYLIVGLLVLLAVESLGALERVQRPEGGKRSDRPRKQHHQQHQLTTDLAPKVPQDDKQPSEFVKGKTMGECRRRYPYPSYYYTYWAAGSSPYLFNYNILSSQLQNKSFSCDSISSTRGISEAPSPYPSISLPAAALQIRRLIPTGNLAGAST
uniref:Putative secreted protein n=1 Tax=Lutzomyia longipalpis TaxID=7200 RepID=A0A7G3AMP3_LUTLO